jgi:hypothetical protein
MSGSIVHQLVNYLEHELDRAVATLVDPAWRAILSRHGSIARDE